MYSWDVDDEEDEEVNELSFTGVNLVIFLIDASQKMRQTVGEEQLSCIQVGLRGALTAIKEKILAAPRDCVAVLTFGNTPQRTKETEFDTVRQLVPLCPPSCGTIHLLEDLLDGETGAKQFEETYGCGDSQDVRVDEALWQCQTMFSGYKGKVAMKSIILMTNSSAPHSDPKRNQMAHRRAQDLHNNNILLDVIPVCDDMEEFSMSPFYNDLRHLGDDTAPLSITNINDISSLVVRRTSAKRSNGKFLLDLGGGTMIGVSTYNIVSKKGKQAKKKLAADTNAELQSRRIFTNPISGRDLLPSDMKKFLSYGGQNIKMTEDEHRSLTSLEKDVPPLKLCGFKPLSTLKHSSYVRPAHFLYPTDAMVAGSKTAFSALLASCSRKQVMAVCKFKARPSSGPSYVGLVPEQERRGFHVVHLPWVDDTRPVPVVSCLAEHVSEEAVDTAKEIITKLRLKRLEPVENCAIQTHVSMIEAHALSRETIHKPGDETLPDLERMERKVGEKSRLFQSQVYEGGYDPEAPAKKAPKPSAKEKPSTQSVAVDMEAEVQRGTVARLSVDTLKTWCKSQGIAVTGKKKADLVQIVCDNFS